MGPKTFEQVYTVCKYKQKLRFNVQGTKDLVLIFHLSKQSETLQLEVPAEKQHRIVWR